MLADLLQGVGDPLGALIAMQLDRKEGPVSPVDDSELWTFMFAHRELLFGRFANHWWSSWADYTWRWGFLRRVQLGGQPLDGFFALPVAMFLRSLRVTDFKADWLPALAESPSTERLKALAVHMPFSPLEVEVVSRLLPKLEVLWVKGVVRHVAHPSLRVLELRGRWTPQTLNEVLAQAVLPSLETLRLELAPQVALGPLAETLAARFPRLTRLGLLELEGQGGVFDELKAVGVLQRLEVLELAPASVEERRVAAELAPQVKILMRDENAPWDNVPA